MFIDDSCRVDVSFTIPGTVALSQWAGKESCERSSLWRVSQIKFPSLWLWKRTPSSASTVEDHNKSEDYADAKYSPDHFDWFSIVWVRTKEEVAVNLALQFFC
jgi:hypothetical protein